MTQLQVQTDLITWFIEAVFIGAVLFTVMYALLFRWWETVTGRSTLAVFAGVAGTLLHEVLIIWGVQTVHLTRHGMQVGGTLDDFLTWLSVVSLGFVGVGVAAFAYQAAQFCLSERNVANRWVSRLFRLGKGHYERVI